jgi:hypothetical protein
MDTHTGSSSYVKWFVQNAFYKTSRFFTYGRELSYPEDCSSFFQHCKTSQPAVLSCPLTQLFWSLVSLLPHDSKPTHIARVSCSDCLGWMYLKSSCFLFNLAFQTNFLTISSSQLFIGVVDQLCYSHLFHSPVLETQPVRKETGACRTHRCLHSRS